LARVLVPVTGLLRDGSAICEDRCLAADLVADRALDRTHRVHVLRLGTRAELLGAARAKRHVGIATDVAALHASLADAEAASDLTDRREVGLGHLRRAVLGAHDRLRDDLDERNARTVVIDKRARRALDATR